MPKNKERCSSTEDLPAFRDMTESDFNWVGIRCKKYCDGRDVDALDFLVQQVGVMDKTPKKLLSMVSGYDRSMMNYTGSKSDDGLLVRVLRSDYAIHPLSNALSIKDRVLCVETSIIAKITDLYSKISPKIAKKEKISLLSEMGYYISESVSSGWIDNKIDSTINELIALYVRLTKQ